jgi:ATP-dependent DNA ligase
LKERREILGKHMTPIENRILLSDLKTINKKSELKHLINLTIAEGLEGLVLKVNVYCVYMQRKTEDNFS